MAAFISALMFMWIICPSDGFLPTKLIASAIQASDHSPTSSITHKDMSRAAILHVAVDLLRDNPNPKSGGSSLKIAALSGAVSEESLVTAYYGERQQGITRIFKRAVKAICDANGDVDLGGENKDAAAHFDSEQFQSGQNRLVEIRRNIVTQIMMENYDLARTETGRLFHTLQDFYSHSNWIENGNYAPYHVLGKHNERPGNIADSNTQTCVDCEEESTRTMNIFNLMNFDFHPYTCHNNIVGDLKRRNVLTSGYFPKQNDINGQEIVKPPGKCSHGGFVDTTSDSHATGGINKDSPYKIWSPHYYLYKEAANVAQQATVDMLQDLRDDVNNDQLFGRYLGIIGMVKNVSIAYVIDTTGNMVEELSEIQATIPAIRTNMQLYMDSFSGNMQVHYILVPLNDPDPGTLFKTNDIERFSSRIAGLTSSGSGDTPEPIGAIIRAVEASEPGSSVYVFTDVSASDVYHLNEARSLILRKKVRISFAFMNSSIKRSSPDGDHHSQTKQLIKNKSIYVNLASISGGQFMNIHSSEIFKLGSLISFSAIPSRRTIFRKSGVLQGTEKHSFPIDSSILEFMISIDGEEISISISTPQGIDPNNLSQYSSSLISSTSYIAQINVTDNSLRGDWTVAIQSKGSYYIQVFGNSVLSFSEEIVTRDSSGLRKIDGKPSQGNPIVVQITVEESDTPLTINALNLLCDSGFLSTTDLTRLDANNYVGALLPPSVAFTLQLLGKDGNGYGFSHISDTSVEISAIDLALSDRDTGFITMRPREHRNVTLVLWNHEEDAQFSLTINLARMGMNHTTSNFFEYTLTPTTAFLEKDSSANLHIDIVLSSDVPDGLAVTFTVVVEAVLNRDVSDFITFSVFTTTRPPPEFRENMISEITLTTLLVLAALMLIVGYNNKL